MPLQPAAERRTTPRTRAEGMSPADRRAHPRFKLPAGYTPILVRAGDADAYDIDGFAYDISRGGLRFELDRALPPGTTIGIQIVLPGIAIGATGPGQPITAEANVVWVEDEDEPGPVKMAAVFKRFARVQDEARLLAHLGTSRYQRLAA